MKNVLTKVSKNAEAAVRKCSSEAVAHRISVKKLFLEISQNSLESTYASLLIHKVAGQGRQHYLKRDPGTDVSYEFCEIWKNTFFTEHLSWLLLVLQNRCSYKFSNIHQKISVLKSFLDS